MLVTIAICILLTLILLPMEDVFYGKKGVTIRKPCLLGLGTNPYGHMTCGGLGTLDVGLY